MSGSLKPLAHWAIYKGFKLRFTHRAATEVSGILTRPDGDKLDFRYVPPERIITVGGRDIHIDEHGWEMEHLCSNLHSDPPSS